ncbi:hypothetical protein BFW01_g3399 [Lasiodiplodia theobromae]|uniref:F-box domain-containing protein n=1 Tax=Lasiodiplodia theobromae TaxID=45133 RepID=A0A5N5DRM6_9PEZI|nr:Vacuolar protein sorting-associated protein 62 [Lasiodiplodia theobromae]KAB2580565.1 hypothetical protein DBV05_g913 [Lasiodiplodia theobromae]KAF4540053.1 Vacuolar protein sorting-associated protein 62 [Lasiodiplodia theobromae]KAF9632536.1 hypothetical protein BFW01_g3399 [Lasiodiplodia theobromae]
MQLPESGSSPLLSLPDELVLDVLHYLELGDLFELAQTCRWGYRLAIPLLWKDVELKDCWTLHPRASRPQFKAQRVIDELADEHDDTPIIKKLLVLATNPSIACHVQTVLHRCHLPTPSIYHELPLFCFRSLTLSNDSRTHKLLMLAIRNMTNVHTLRIIYGHYFLAYGLIWGFLHPHRPRSVPLKRLWLEYCSLSMPEPGPIGSSFWPDLSGITSLRLRRLSYLNDLTQRNVITQGMALSRAQLHRRMLQNGIGGEYMTTIDKVVPDGTVSPASLSEAARLDKIIYDALPEAKEFLESTHVPEDQQFEKPRPAVPADFLKTLLKDSAATLTSLNLDMLLSDDAYRNREEWLIRDMFFRLSHLRFPYLRAFQLRNVMTPWTTLPRGTYLLDRLDTPGSPTPVIDFLEFMDAHPNISCLSWPMENFFSHQRSDGEAAIQQDRVISNLARTLKELRVDTTFHPDAERDHSGDFRYPLAAKGRRWHFITRFASRMTKVEHLKMEGGIPREEKHETVRALWQCPLNKIVMIANSSPIGNCWGSSDLFQTVPDDDDWDLDDEDLNALKDTAAKAPTPPGQDFEFVPQYDWLRGSLMLHTVASFHADTVTELKFCGYVGAPILFAPTELSHPLLSPLRHFHNLRNLTMSMWLDTNFEDRHRDEEIIQFWLNTRDPDTTAMVVIVPDDGSSSESEFNIEDSDVEMRPPTPPSPRPPTTPPGAADPELQFYHHLQNHIAANPTNPHPLPDPPEEVAQAQQQQPPALDATTTITTNNNHENDNHQPPAAIAQHNTTHHLVAVTADPVTGPEPVLASSRQLSWPRRLHTMYAPRALAGQVARQIGPYLSPQAKARPGAIGAAGAGAGEGVVVRASFCLGHSAGWGTVFDIDVGVGLGRGGGGAGVGSSSGGAGASSAAGGEGMRGDWSIGTGEGKVLWWEGPREEGERRRWWGKLKARRWF